jgi:Ca2+-binding RTX toxin-like protein
MRTLPPALLALSLALLPAAADAATVTMSSSAGPAADIFISYRAGSRETNRLTVKKSGRYVYFTDTGLRSINAKPNRFFGNCVKTAARTARCPAATAVITLRDGNDRASFSYPGTGDDAIPTDPTELADPFIDTEGGFLETIDIDAGSGDDVIGGTPFTDYVFPGPGRDRVSTGGGQDRVIVKADGVPDVLKGGVGLNTLDFFNSAAVRVDTRAGTASSGSETDTIRSFRRVFGGPANDILRGGDVGEALYGGGGTDLIDGRDGADYLAGDIPIDSTFFPDRVYGGEGDDVVDVRDRPLKPTSAVDCGPGADRVAAQEDDKLTACEASSFAQYPNLSDISFSLGDVDYGLLTPIAPVSRGPDGAPTYDVPCPAGGNPCSGSVTLERPPASSTTTPEQLGAGSFTIPAGERRNVTVVLNPAGVAALATPGAVLSIHVRGSIPPPASPPGQSARQIDFGWQTAF